MHRTYLAGIERSIRNPSLQNLVKLANALGVSIPRLFEGESQLAGSAAFGNPGAKGKTKRRIGPEIWLGPRLSYQLPEASGMAHHSFAARGRNFDPKGAVSGITRPASDGLRVQVPCGGATPQGHDLRDGRNLGLNAIRLTPRRCWPHRRPCGDGSHPPQVGDASCAPCGGAERPPSCGRHAGQPKQTPQNCR
jgi:transcriptional regulator with XRE-family HTH domain